MRRFFVDCGRPQDHWLGTSEALPIIIGREERTSAHCLRFAALRTSAKGRTSRLVLVCMLRRLQSISQKAHIRQRCACAKLSTLHLGLRVADCLTSCAEVGEMQGNSSEQSRSFRAMFEKLKQSDFQGEGNPMPASPLLQNLAHGMLLRQRLHDIRDPARDNLPVGTGRVWKTSATGRLSFSKKLGQVTKRHPVCKVGDPL